MIHRHLSAMARALLSLGQATVIVAGAKSENAALPSYQRSGFEGAMSSNKKLRMLKTLAVGVVLTALSSVANANFISYTWVDHVDPADVSVPPAYRYQHDLTNNADAFLPLNDYIEWYSLSVHLYDDQYDGWFNAGEWALIEGAGGGWLGDRAYFDLSNSFAGTAFEGASLIGWLQLNLTGTYDVVVSSASGDFMFGSSRLTARGYWNTERRPMPVPEPGTLALLAIGLIGMGVALSRRRNQK
jgi:hypothetical protein